MSITARHYTKQFGENGLWKVTPEIAQVWLGNMDKNRTVRRSQVKRFIYAMQNDQWEINGETLKFNREGMLFDGQHRLLACIESGITFYTFVIFDIEKCAQSTVNIGIKRSPGDLFTLAGYVNGKNLAAAARYVWRYENNLMTTYTGFVAPSEQVLLNIVVNHPELEKSMVYYHSHSPLKYSPLIVALHYFCTRKSIEQAHFFFDTLISGENIERKHPIFVLRRRMLENAQHRAKFPDYEIAAWIIKAWNSFREGKPMAFVRWIKSGEQAEEFPFII